MSEFTSGNGVNSDTLRIIIEILIENFDNFWNFEIWYLVLIFLYDMDLVTTKISMLKAVRNIALLLGYISIFQLFRWMTPFWGIVSCHNFVFPPTQYIIRHHYNLKIAENKTDYINLQRFMRNDQKSGNLLICPKLPWCPKLPQMTVGAKIMGVLCKILW